MNKENVYELWLMTQEAVDFLQDQLDILAYTSSQQLWGLFTIHKNKLYKDLLITILKYTKKEINQIINSRSFC